MDTSTRSDPNSDMSGARRDAQLALGDSRVPRRASVKIEIFRSGLEMSLSLMVSIFAVRYDLHHSKTY